MSIIILIFLLFFTAMLSCSETALFSIPQITLSTYKNSEDKKKKLIEKLLSNPRELLVTILMLNIFINILIQNTVSNIFFNFSSWFLKVGIPLLLILFLGEIIPKSIAITNNEYIAYIVSPIISLMYKILIPFRVFLTFITKYISRMMFFFLKKEKPMDIEELKHILSTSKKTKILTEEEVKLFKGYLDLKNCNVKEIMTPREEIVFYDINSPIGNLIKLFQTQKFCLVCDKDLNKILGIINIKDFFFEKEKFLKKIIKKPKFFPESTKAADLIKKMKKNIAIIVDEYGEIVGTVSTKDLIEKVIGKIEDIKKIKDVYTRYANDVIIANGKMELVDFKKIFNVDLISHANKVTIGGWIIEQLEKIPSIGEKLEKQGFIFYILEASSNKIKKIYIRKIL